MEWKPLTLNDLDRVLPWFDDPETQRRLGGFFPVGEQLKLIEQNPDKHGWISFADDVPIGLCELEVEDGTIGYVMILVAPAQRGQGKAIILANHLTEAAKKLGLKELQAWIEPDAQASRACFLRAGYLEAKTTDDGFDLFRFTLSS